MITYGRIMTAACSVRNINGRLFRGTVSSVKRGVKMTVKELIGLNMMITDVEITVRKNGSVLIDQLNIGCAEGVKPPYPTQVPIEERYAGTLDTTRRKDAHYVPKSINSWDDGKDYWEIKVNRIPEKWLNLEVTSWEVWPAPGVGDNPRRYRNNNFHGQRIRMDVLPSGESLAIKEPKRQQVPEEQLEGQMSIADWEYEVMNI